MNSRFAMSSVERCSSSRSRTSTSRADSAPAMSFGTPPPIRPPLRSWSSRRLAISPDSAVGDSAEERDDPLGRLALQEVPGRTRANRREQVFLGAGRRQNDDLAAGSRGAETRQRRQPVEAGHGEVEQDEVRLELGGEPERLDAVGCFTDHVEAALRQQRRERVAREGMVVDDEDSLRHVPLIGRSSAAD
jgi:hypothetical protein